jgi:hypothetical protein
MQVFLVMRRTDIPDGVLQQVDLKPNTSNRNYIYTPSTQGGQTGYIRNIAPSPAITPFVLPGPPFVATAALTGLAAYYMGNVDQGPAPGGPVLIPPMADLAAATTITAAQAGTILDSPTIAALLVAAGAIPGTTIDAGGSTGSVAEVLSILSGRVYDIAAGSLLSDGAGAFAGRVGTFDDTTYRHLYDNDGFVVSNTYGNLSLMKSADFTYDGTTGAAIVVYSATGTVM